MRQIIHWREGLFLQQHHLQIQQRMVVEGMNDLRLRGHLHPYGVIEASISYDHLRDRKLRMERLKAILRSGLEVHYPGNLEMDPAERDIAAEFARSEQGLLVYLGVPHWHADAQNTVGEKEEVDSRSSIRYKVRSDTFADENDGKSVQPIEMLKIRGRLFIEGENMDNWEVLPLCRIARDPIQGWPMEDLHYAPPCVQMRGSMNLYRLVEDLMEQILATRKHLYEVIVAREVPAAEKSERLMRFQTLNRLGAKFRAWLYEDRRLGGHLLALIHPYECYLELAELMAEMAVFNLDRDWLEFLKVSYRHEDPYPAFRELNDAIRAMLPLSRDTCMELTFSDAGKAMGLRVLSVSLHPEHIAKPNGWYLALESNLETTALANFVLNPALFKVMAGSSRNKLVGGIPLETQRYTPALPFRNDLSYFRLDISRNQAEWELVRKERELILLYNPTKFNMGETRFKLVMTVPVGNEGL
ncbi:MAG: type VI secretion system baseplate subunit TssK [Verrucomicrobiae bacterium]|nr:type VI secretion system baseplate subunit TssK [Verrucomicrobiae bacterium]